MNWSEQVSKAIIILIVGIMAVLVGYVSDSHYLSFEERVAAFKGIQELSPETLTSYCGAPAKREIRTDLGQSVLDLHYEGRSGRDVVFRFIASRPDFHGWSASNALGVWEHVDSGGLGEPIDDVEVLKHMPCLVSGLLRRTWPYIDLFESLNRRVLDSQVVEAGASHGAELQQTEQVPGDVTKTGPIGASGGVGSGPGGGLGSLGGWKGPGLGSGFSPKYNFGSGGSLSGGGSGSPDKIEPFFIPCPSGTGFTGTMCNVIENEQFLKEINETLGTEADSPEETDMWDGIERMVTKLSGYRPIIVQMPEAMADRDKVMKAIFEVEVRTANLVTIELKRGVARLTPFPEDDSGHRYTKLYLATKDEMTRRNLWKKAVEDAAPRNNTTWVPFSWDGRRGGIRFNDMPTLRYLIQVKKEGGDLVDTGKGTR